MKNQMTVTLNQIKNSKINIKSWRKILDANGGETADLNKMLLVSSVLESNDLEDTLWLVSCLPEYNYIWRKFAHWCASEALNNFDDGIRRMSWCLKMAEYHSNCLITNDQMASAREKMKEIKNVSDSKRYAIWSIDAASSFDICSVAHCVQWSSRFAIQSKEAYVKPTMSHLARVNAEATQEERLLEILETSKWGKIK